MRRQATVLPGTAANKQAVVNRGLSSWWLHLPNRLGGGGTILRDLMGRKDGTLTSGPTWAGPQGRPGGYGAISLTAASSHYIATTYSAAFGTNNFLVACWMRATTTTGFQIMVGKDESGQRDWNFQLSATTTGKWGWTAQPGTGSPQEAGTTLSAGTWYHLAYTRVGTTGTFYTNGKADGTFADSANYAATGNVAIGRRNFAGFPQYFGGQIDDVRIVVGGALSAAVVLSMYRDSCAGYQDGLNWIAPGRAGEQAGGAVTAKIPWHLFLGMGA